jgi:two-component system, NarL family, nitrate/nitrite response regulator NarL
VADPRVKVIVVDDHPFFRDGVSRGLALDGRIELVGEAGDGLEALELIARESPDVAVVDYQMPGLDGIGVVHAVKRDALATRVLLVSAVTDGAIVFKALEEGAAGYLSKESSRSQIIDGVMRVSRGDTVIPPELAGSVAEQIRLRAGAGAPVLTPRELEVLRGFAAGQSIPELAAELFVAPSTVKTHTQRLYEKLEVSDRAAAVATAMRLGLLE